MLNIEKITEMLTWKVVMCFDVKEWVFDTSNQIWQILMKLRYFLRLLANFNTLMVLFIVNL